MTANTKNPRVLDPGGGTNQARMRDYNERLVISLISRHEALAKADIARRTGLTPQTVSGLIRALEADGLLLRGEKRRGRVGQPSVPMRLDPLGALSVGLKIGRRSAELVLMDFTGQVRERISQTYRYAAVAPLLDFVRDGFERIAKPLSPELRSRIVGVGVAMPFELWNWCEEAGVPEDEAARWRDVDFAAELAEISGLPVFVQNDATAACGAELTYGEGTRFSDFAYFFIGTFVGGGIVINQAIFPGRSGNAGALGSMPVAPDGDTPAQLIDRASLFALEAQLVAAGQDASALWQPEADWSVLEPWLDRWITSTAEALAMAAVAACAVLDFQAAVIDGALPDAVRARIVERTTAALGRHDLQGIVAPQIVAGSIGADARVLGACALPLSARFLVDQSVLFGAPKPG